MALSLRHYLSQERAITIRIGPETAHLVTRPFRLTGIETDAISENIQKIIASNVGKPVAEQRSFDSFDGQWLAKMVKSWDFMVPDPNDETGQIEVPVPLVPSEIDRLLPPDFRTMVARSIMDSLDAMHVKDSQGTSPGEGNASV